MQLPVQLILLSLSSRTMQLQLTTHHTHQRIAAYHYFHFHACLKTLDSLHSHHVENISPYLAVSVPFPSLLKWAAIKLFVVFCYQESNWM
jgi:hypothetical protein